MPFKSKAQERFLFARHPSLAKTWLAKYGQPKDLPKHLPKKKRRPKAPHGPA